MKPRTFEQAIDLILTEMKEVMLERHQKYGPKNILQLGNLGVLNRAKQDKMERLHRYYEREDLRAKCCAAGMPASVVDQYLPALQADYSDESLDDAHIDAANYLGPISLMLRRGWWTLPMAGDRNDCISHTS